MAEHPLVADLLSDAIIRILDRVARKIAGGAARVLHALAEHAEPRSGVVLYASDGAVYTGVVLVERNQPVAMLVFRHEGTKQPDRPPVVTPPPRTLFEQPSYGRDDAQHWREGDDVPFWRR